METLGVENHNDTDTDFEDIIKVKKNVKKTKRGRGKKIALLSFIIVVLLGVLAAVGLFVWSHNQVESIQQLDVSMDDFTHEEIPEERLEEGGTNFLVLGSDSRESGGTNTWTEGAQRSDVMMIVQISADGKHITGMSIPRDAAALIPGHEDEGMTKINHSLMYGGIPLAVQTVEKVTGIRIDHVAFLDFQSFAHLTDAVGGVTLTSKAEGTKTYNGTQALAFVRQRKGLPNSDFDRVRRQQAWMKAVMQKVFTKEVMSNPLKFKEVYDAVIPYVAVDDSLDMSELLSLGSTLSGVRASSMDFVTAPTGSEQKTADGKYNIFYFDEARFTPLCEAFQKGQAWKYLEDNKGQYDTLDSRPLE